MKLNYFAIIISLLLLSTCITATVAENCKIQQKTACANGSTIALTVALSLLVAVTSIFWFKPVYFPGLTEALPRPVLFPRPAA